MDNCRLVKGGGGGGGGGWGRARGKGQRILVASR